MNTELKITHLSINLQFKSGFNSFGQFFKNAFSLIEASVIRSALDKMLIRAITFKKAAVIVSFPPTKRVFWS